MLSKSDYLPPMLLGKKGNDMRNCWKNYPIIDDKDFGPSLRYYTLLTFGYHIMSLFKLFKTNNTSKRSDFMEMFLHHCVTLMLYFMAYMNTWMKYGSLLMFLHDWADIPTPLIKAFNDTKFKAAMFISAFTNLLVWGYSRLYVYPQVIYYGQYLYFKEDVLRDDSQFDYLKIFWYGSTSLQCMLQVLHIFWFYLFARVVYKACLGEIKEKDNDRLSNVMGTVSKGYEKQMFKLKEMMMPAKMKNH